MTHTKIKIEREGDGAITPMFLSGILASLLLGMSLGIVFDSLSFTPPKIVDTNMLASPLFIETTREAAPKSATEAKATSTSIASEVQGDSMMGSNLEVPTPVESPLFTPPDSLAQKQDEVRGAEGRVANSEAQVTFLTNEIERIKNESILIVTDFNTNCGAWKDNCATPFSASLEKNNTTYAELARKLILEKSLLVERESDLVLLAQ